MTSCTKKLAVLAALVAGLLMASSTAQASYFYEVFEDGSNVGVLPSGVQTNAGTSFQQTFSTADFSITMTSSFTVQNPSLTTLNTQLQASLNPGAGTHTIELKLAYTDYTLPNGNPKDVSSAGSATFSDATAGNTATGQAWADATDSSTFNTGATAGQQIAINPTTTVGTNLGVVLNPNPAQFQFVGTTFSLKQDLTLKLTSDLNTSGQVQLITTVASPAPAGLVLAFTAAPFLGLGAWIRRRRQPKQA